MSLIMYNDFNAAFLLTGELNKLRVGQNVYLNYMNKSSPKIHVETPVMYSPFGVSIYPPNASYTDVKKSYSIDLSFNNFENDEELAQMKNIIESIDSAMIEFGIKNSLEWFGKQMSRSVIEELYRPILRPSKNNKYAPTFKLKIRTDYNTGIPNIECFNADNIKMNLDSIQKGDKMKAIFEFSPIWFMNKQFGVSLNVTSVMVTETKPTITHFTFHNDN